MFGLGVIGVLVGVFQYQVDLQCLLVDGFWSWVVQYFYVIVVDVQVVVVDFYFVGKVVMGGVEVGQVFDVGLVGQVVQCDDFEVQLFWVFVQCVQDVVVDMVIVIECDVKRWGGYWQGQFW